MQAHLQAHWLTARAGAAQVRFGVLNAGNYGVSQSRKRTFIWGVAPGNALPDWPAPLHVFRSPQLTIKLPGGAQVTVLATPKPHTQATLIACRCHQPSMLPAPLPLTASRRGAHMCFGGFVSVHWRLLMN